MRCHSSTKCTTLAPEHVKRASAQRITYINLVVGKLSGLVDESVQLYSNEVGFYD